MLGENWKGPLWMNGREFLELQKSYNYPNMKLTANSTPLSGKRCHSKVSQRGRDWKHVARTRQTAYPPLQLGIYGVNFVFFFGGLLLVCFAYRFPPLSLLLMPSVEESLEKVFVLTHWAFYYPLGYSLTQLCTNSFLHHKSIMTPTMC